MSVIYSLHSMLQARVAFALEHLSKRGLVVIHGPSGCGKTHLSAWLHGHSSYADQPLQVQEAAGLAASRFESQLFGHVKGAFTGAVQPFPGLLGITGRGVLLLESIEDLSMDGQARLLRFLETRTYRPVGSVTQCRFAGGLILTCRFPLKLLLDRKQMREDFYFRIAGGELSLPPIGERPQDFESIFRKLADEVAAELGKSGSFFDEDDFRNCQSRQWFGGLHELRNLLFRAGILAVPTASLTSEATEIATQRLPETGSLKTDLASLEKALLLRGLRVYPQSRQALADHLGVSMRTLMYKLKRHQLP